MISGKFLIHNEYLIPETITAAHANGVRQKESGAVRGHALVAPHVGNGSDGKGISVLWFNGSPRYVLPESLLTRAEISVDRQTVVRGPSFMGWG